MGLTRESLRKMESGPTPGPRLGSQGFYGLRLWGHRASRATGLYSLPSYRALGVLGLGSQITIVIIIPITIAIIIIIVVIRILQEGYPFWGLVT